MISCSLSNVITHFQRSNFHSNVTETLFQSCLYHSLGLHVCGESEFVGTFIQGKQQKLNPPNDFMAVCITYVMK